MMNWKSKHFTRRMTRVNLPVATMHVVLSQFLSTPQRRHKGWHVLQENSTPSSLASGLKGFQCTLLSHAAALRAMKDAANSVRPTTGLASVQATAMTMMDSDREIRQFMAQRTQPTMLPRNDPMQGTISGARAMGPVKSCNATNIAAHPAKRSSEVVCEFSRLWWSSMSSRLILVRRRTQNTNTTRTHKKKKRGHQMTSPG